MAYSFKGSISFGLVYIPITLHTSVKSNDISFNQLDKKTNSRVQYKKTCVDCEGRELVQSDIVKGYQYEKNKYVLFSDEDFEKLKSKKDKAITIKEFVKLSEIDPLYFEKAYYVVPESGAEKAFCILRDAMAKEGKVGIAKSVIGTKEVLAAIRIKNGEMLLSTLYFADEVSHNPARGIEAEISPKEVELAVSIIEGMSTKFDIRAYKDEYRDRVIGAITKKINGREILPQAEADETRVASLMEALLKSVELTKNNETKTTKKRAAEKGKAAEKKLKKAPLKPISNSRGATTQA